MSQKISRVTEEKVKKLKKRNSELVSIARQLEEKAKKLQEEKNSALVSCVSFELDNLILVVVYSLCFVWN